jgi:hypothetical protein
MQEPLPQPFGPPAAPVASITTTQPYNSVATMGKILMALLGIGAFVDLMSIFFSGLQLSSGVTASSEMQQMMIGLLQLLVFFITAILFLFWMHRAYSNLKSFGATDLSFSPGWAIGYFFVPFLNLWKPFEAMSEIWKASDPNTRVDASGQWKSAATGALLNAWWIMWLVSNIAGQVVMRTSLEADQPAEIMSATRVAMIADLLGVFSAILALLVVSEVTRRQEEKHRQTVAAAQPSPFTS